MTALRDCTDPATWWPHVDEATRALAAGGLVVMPTDTVYGIAADAFKPDAVQALLDAKGRGRQMPPPVLIGDVRTLDGLADAIPDVVRELVEKHWPGPLTVILRAQPSLQWDLGETHGTVALRMPDHELALAVLRRTGPLAVSSANVSGSPAATTAADAEAMLGTSVRVYLDGGTSPGGVASTIVDATGPELRIVREGALSAEDLGIAPTEAPAVDGEPAATPAPRKPRARKLKPAAEPSEAAADEASVVAAEASAAGDEPTKPAPRKPRARKPTPAVEPSDAPADEASEPAAEASAAAEPSATADEPIKPAPRKPRARKPKPAVEPSDAAIDEPTENAAEASESIEASEPAEATAAVERPARKPRTRKPRPPAPSDSAEPEPVAQQAGEVEAAEPSAPTSEDGTEPRPEAPAP